MNRELAPANCNACHFSCYTKEQRDYAEEHGTPLTESCKVLCSVKREYVFKDDVCNDYTEKHEEIR